MARDLEDALVLERSDPRAALRALARVDRTNRESGRVVFLVSVGSVLVAGTIAFALTRGSENDPSILALLVFVTVGFAPPTFVWFSHENRMYEMGLDMRQVVARAVLWAPLLVLQELVLLLACFLVVTLPVALVLTPIAILLPEPAQTVMGIATIALGIAVGLADVLPVVLLAPAYGTAETLAGLKLNAAQVTQFGIAVFAGLTLGTGALGLVYPQWWQALLATGTAGVFLGLTLEPLRRDLTISYLVELSRIRCDVRLGRLGSARWRIRHLLDRVSGQREWASGAGPTACNMTTLMAHCLERPADQRWWATGTTADEMGGHFAALMSRDGRNQARLDWVRLRLDHIAELRDRGDEHLRGLTHESAWAQSRRSTLVLTELREPLAP